MAFATGEFVVGGFGCAAIGTAKSGAGVWGSAGRFVVLVGGRCAGGEWCCHAGESLRYRRDWIDAVVSQISAVFWN